MAFGNGPRIVTNGLVLSLDAGDRNSYVSGSNTWFDLSGNNYSGSLFNGPTFSSGSGGSIVFDGIDDRVSRSGSIDTGQNFTVNAWIYPTLLGTTRRCVVANSYDYIGPNGWNFSTAGGNTNNTFFMAIGADAAFRVAAANTLSTNTWQYITAVVTNGGGTITLYKNGNSTDTQSSVINPNTMTYTLPQFNIGFRHIGGTTDPYTGNIALVQIYNRALSQQEVLQNYNAQKSRFGL